mmetsp:Transcript_51122/g.121468  ORF Transcript_51122/g.121468 Transcript_51122/m.121468 type:complete len:339 (+) Transcript_51122:259-1275(+)
MLSASMVVPTLPSSSSAPSSAAASSVSSILSGMSTRDTLKPTSDLPRKLSAYPASTENRHCSLCPPATSTNFSKTCPAPMSALPLFSASLPRLHKPTREASNCCNCASPPTTSTKAGSDEPSPSMMCILFRKFLGNRPATIRKIRTKIQGPFKTYWGPLISMQIDFRKLKTSRWCFMSNSGSLRPVMEQSHKSKMLMHFTTLPWTALWWSQSITFSTIRALMKVTHCSHSRFSSIPRLSKSHTAMYWRMSPFAESLAALGTILRYFMTSFEWGSRSTSPFQFLMPPSGNRCFTSCTRASTSHSSNCCRNLLNHLEALRYLPPFPRSKRTMAISPKKKG